MWTIVAASLVIATIAAVGERHPLAAQPVAQTATDNRVALTAGQSAAMRKGTVVGHDSVTYVVSGRKGQTLTVDLQTKSTSLYFNVLPTGNPEAIYASDRGETGNTASVTLPADGDYQVMVYLFRNAARRGSKAPFTIALSIK